MVNEAKEHEADDKLRRELIDAKNELDSLIYSAEKSIREYGDKLQSSDIDALNKALEDARAKKDSDDINVIKATKDELMKASHKLAEVMYAQANAAGGAQGQAAQGAPKDDDVIDAEFEEN